MNLVMDMKRLKCIIVLIFFTSLVTIACVSKSNSIENANSVESTVTTVGTTNDTESKVTKEMAYNGVNNYCHKMYDWDIAKENPDIMSVDMGEENDREYQVIFRSYTGTFVYFYVDKLSGNTKMVDYVPAMNIREESGTIILFDYLDK